MAGRYVILEFEDREAANKFVKMGRIHEQLRTKPVAMYLKPKKFCQCPDKSRQQQKNWRKHKKYGLYICERCGMPSQFHNRGILQRLQYAFGYNLLED
jgi:hypothetical protein